MPQGKRCFDALTGLRFFAAVGVVLYHFSTPIAERGPRFLGGLVGSGFVAVSFFYVLSGFVLSYSYVDEKGQMNSRPRPFWAARIARIYPAYFLAFLLAAPYNIQWTMRVNHLTAGIAKLAFGGGLVLAMQQAWTPWTAWYWNFPAWSVSVEAFFYLVFPLAALGLKFCRVKTSFLAMCALWLVGLIAPVALWLKHGGTPATGDLFARVVEFNPLLRLPEFLMGVLLGRLYILGFRFSPHVGKVLSYVSLAVVLLCCGFSPAFPRPLLASGLLAPLFAALIFTLADGEGLLVRSLSLPPLVILGEASYAIYILQIPIAYVLRQPPPYTSFPLLLLYLTVLVTAALLAWKFVETPLRPFIRKQLLRDKPAKAKWTPPVPSANIEVPQRF